MSGGDAASSEDAAELQYVKAKTSVWWDIENCHVPRVCDPFAIAQNINSALSKMNYCGPVSISAYGDTNRIPTAVQQALSSTGIALNHVPAGVKDASDKKILVDMLFWAVDNPAPGNYLLISGDRDFSNALHQLRMRRYNILLAQPNKASAALVSAAKSVWLWSSLVAGGGPITKNESTQLVNGSNHYSMETSQDHNSETFHAYQPGITHSDNPTVGNHKFASPVKVGGADPKYKVKHAWKNMNSPSGTSLTKAQSMPMVVQESRNYEYNHQPEYSQGRGYHRAPHECFGPVNHGTSASLSAPNSISSNINPSDTIYRPKGFPTHSNFGPGSMGQATAANAAFRPAPFRPVRPAFPSSTFASTPDIGKLSISGIPNYVQSPMNAGSKLNSYENSNGGSMNPTPASISNQPGAYSAAGSLPPPSENELELLGLVLHALDSLKNEMISPSEANIADCIRYGGLKNRNIDVKKALDVAIKRQMVIWHTLGDLQLYVNKGQKLWKCANPIGGNPNQYPKPTWEKIQKFLTSPDGRSAIIASSSKYEAGLILKRSCLQDLPLGDVLRILSMLVGAKKWIKHNYSGWQPVTVTLTEESEEASNEAAS